MSFSGQVKSELCRTVPAQRCCALAQCFGILLYCNTFTGDGVRIVTESRELGELLPKLFRKAFGFSFDGMPEALGTKRCFGIWDPGKLRTILEAYGFSREDTVALHVNLGVLEEDCCKIAFLRGAFLAGGSVTDPAKGYHQLREPGDLPPHPGDAGGLSQADEAGWQQCAVFQAEQLH